MIENLKSLQIYLQQNNMKKTLQILRAQILSRIPNKPSHQFYQLFDLKKNPQQSHRSLIEASSTCHDFSKIKPKKANPLPVEGLLGKIAYSSNLIDNNNVTQKINHLMGNRIFIHQLTKLFPETKPTPNQLLKHSKQQYLDELDMIQANSSDNLNNESSQISHNNQVSSIDFNNLDQDDSIISHTNRVLDEFYVLDQEEEYSDDRDCGYYQHVFDQESLAPGCQELSKVYNYPHSALRQQKKKDDSYVKFKLSIQTVQKQKFPKGMIFPNQKDPIYPIEYNGICYDTMPLKIVYDREKIGYQQKKEFELKKGDIIAGKYQVEKILGNGVFAKVIKARDLGSEDQQMTCLKMIQNDKDFFDQSLDQLKLLRYIKSNCNPNEHFLLNFKQVFYHREHLFIETDLLKDNLLTAFQNNPSFFSLSVIKKIAIQILEALVTLHRMNIIHADLKPQNIMVKTYNPIEVRVIDLGNGSFTHDQNLSNYVQSRSYRAPQVILGCGYNEKIDIWSLGCILAQLWTKNVLFFNHHIQGMIARIQSIVGPWPQWMLQNGQNNFIYYHDNKKQMFHIFVPKKTTLKNRLRCDDELFIDFIRCLVEIDPIKRLSARQAIEHPFLKY